MKGIDTMPKKEIIKLKYEDLTDNRTLTYKLFKSHFDSIESRREQLKREENLLNSLIKRMENQHEINFDDYNVAIAQLNYSNKNYTEIIKEIFEKRG